LIGSIAGSDAVQKGRIPCLLTAGVYQALISYAAACREVLMLEMRKFE
jgi:hypothetical protein